MIWKSIVRPVQPQRPMRGGPHLPATPSGQSPTLLASFETWRWTYATATGPSCTTCVSRPEMGAKHANFHMALAEPKPDWLRKTASNQRDQRRGWRMRCSNRSIARAIALGHSQAEFDIIAGTHQQ